MIYSFVLIALISAKTEQLGSPSYEVREAATSFLVAMNCPVCDQLVNLYQCNVDPEREWRIRRVCELRLSGGQFGTQYTDKVCKMTKPLPWE